MQVRMKQRVGLKLLRLSFQIRANQINQILSQLGSNLLLGAIGEMEPDMRFENFCHQAVDAAAHGSKKHQLTATIVIRGQKPLHRIQLAAQAPYSLQKFQLFPLLYGQGSPRLTIPTPGIVYTVYGYGQRPL